MATVTVLPPLTEEFKSELGISRSDYFFLLVQPPNDGSVVLPNRGRVFDPKGEFGPRGGTRLVRDDALRDSLFADSFCDVGGDPQDYLLLRTRVEIDDRGRLGVPTVAKLPIKQETRTSDFPTGLMVVTGGFDDTNNNGVRDASDEIACSGGGFHNIAFKLAPDASPVAAKRAYLRESGD